MINDICASSLFIFLFDNKAAFMITREEFPNLSGLDDHRLSNPTSIKPPFRFGTIPNGATDYVLKNNFPLTHEYMKK